MPRWRGLLTHGDPLDIVVGSHGRDFGDSTPFTLQIISTVPEPEAGSLLAAGLALLGLCARRRRRSRTCAAVCTPAHLHRGAGPRAGGRRGTRPSDLAEAVRFELTDGMNRRRFSRPVP